MRKSRLLGLLLAAVVPLALLPACSADESTMADLINNQRRQAGVPAIRVDANASAVARDWAATMAREGRLRHHPNLRGAIERHVGKGWKVYGENVGFDRDVYGVFHRWMHSSGHKANVLRRGYNRMGVGVVHSGGRTWVSVIFIGY